MPTPAATASKASEAHGAPGGQTARPTAMAFEIGHSGNDLSAMVLGIRNRFWICLLFTVPIFVFIGRQLGHFHRSAQM